MDWVTDLTEGADHFFGDVPYELTELNKANATENSELFS